MMPDTHIDRLLEQGEACFKVGDMNGARECFEKILSFHPHHVEALNDLGVLRFQDGMRKEAILLFREALALEPRHLEASGNLAACLAEEGELPETVALLQRMLGLGEKGLETYASLVSCLLRMNDLEAAGGALREARALHGDREVLSFLAAEINRQRELRASPALPPQATDRKRLRELRARVVIGLKANPQDGTLRRMREHLAGLERLQELPIAIVSACDLLEKDPERRLRWGDHWFARELAEALSTRGAVVTTGNPRVLLHLHGVPLREVKGPIHNIVWLHSHPDFVSSNSLSIYHHIFCLSPRFLQRIAKMGRSAELLIGGTAKRPPTTAGEITHGLVFVGNGRQGGGRKIISDLLSLGDRWIQKLEIWGEGWEGIVPKRCFRGLYFDNAQLPALYASAHVVLNDHHEDMRLEGFLNPRILDVMASGGVVVSDELASAPQIFGDALLTYRTPDELDKILRRLFEDDHFRAEVRAAGLAAVEPYRFDQVADRIVRHLLALDEMTLERRAKNNYMTSVWAPVKGKVHTDRIRRLKLVTAEECLGKTLDVGCGNGDSTAIMKDHNPSLNLTALELTDWGCKEAARNHPGIALAQGDAVLLPFKDRSFDTVVLDHVIEHFKDPVPLILEAKRLARQRVVIGIPILHLNDPDHKIAWRVDDFRSLLFGFFPRCAIRGMREPDGVEVGDDQQWQFVVATGYLDGEDRKEVRWKGPLRLHLGCGQRRLPEFVNIDILPSPAVDLLCDSRRLPFSPGSASRIETYHMIEHLPRHAFMEALYEWNRVLEEGADLVIECPDFEATVREYLAGKHFRINNIFGLQRHPGDYHLFGYGFEDLKERLEAAGFRGVTQEPPTDYHAHDEPSLRVVATKVFSLDRPPDLRGVSIRQTQENYATALKAAAGREQGVQSPP